MRFSMPASTNSELYDVINAFNDADQRLQELDFALMTLTNRMTQLKNFPLPDELAPITQFIKDIQLESTRLQTIVLHQQNAMNTLKLQREQTQKTWQAQQKTIDTLNKEKEKYIDIMFHAKNMACEEGSLYMTAIVKDDLHRTIGTGMDFVKFETMPRAEDQSFSLEQALMKAKEAIGRTETELLRIDTLIADAVTRNTTLLAQLQTKMLSLGKDKTQISHAIDELETLLHIYHSKTLYGAAARGDIKEIISALTSQSPNRRDEYFHLPIYYASRFGQAQAVNVLFDATALTKNQKDELLNLFPAKETKEFALLVSLLKENKANFDYLWRDDASIGNNIISVSKDYYSPAIFMPFNLLSDQAKLILTGNWYRPLVSLDLAKKIADLFEHLEEPDRKNENLCRTLLTSKWDAFHQQNANPHNESFARRFYYLNDKISLINAPCVNKERSPNAVKLSSQPSRLWHKSVMEVELEPLAAQNRYSTKLTS